MAQRGKVLIAKSDHLNLDTWRCTVKGQTFTCLFACTHILARTHACRHEYTH